MKIIENEWRWFDEELNMPYPWYTSTALKIIETWDLKGKRVFEYGVGDSTLWYRSKGAIVCGVDSNLEWANKNGAMFKPYFPEYAESIKIPLSFGQFDIVVIDGEWRDECTVYALSALKPGGFLIIDNYKQPSVGITWPKTERILDGMTHGIHKEPAHPDWNTAIIYKPDNSKLR